MHARAAAVGRRERRLIAAWTAQLSAPEAVDLYDRTLFVLPFLREVCEKEVLAMPLAICGHVTLADNAQVLGRQFFLRFTSSHVTSQEGNAWIDHLLVHERMPSNAEPSLHSSKPDCDETMAELFSRLLPRAEI